MSRTRPRVLWVDDDAQGLLRPLLGLLTRSGLDVETAPDTVSALHRLEKEAFDAFLLDVILPNSSSAGSLASNEGIRLAEKIRTLETGKGARIVFLTVVRMDEVLDSMRDIGAKLFDKTTLFSHGEIAALVDALRGPETHSQGPQADG